MENSANKSGKMTTDRADAIKAFVRQAESNPCNDIGKRIKDLGTPVFDKAMLDSLGRELVAEWAR